MSDTSKKYTPRPYFNVALSEEAEEDMKSYHQNPKGGNTDQSPANSATQNSNEDTSEATYEKRWKDLKKHYDTEVSSLRQQIQKMEEQNNKATFTPPKTEEELKAFKEKSPEFYDMMLTIAHQQASTQGESASSRIRQLEETLAEVEQEKSLVLIGKAHSDFVEVVKSPAFLEWLELQDSSIQGWVKNNSNNANQFIRALDLYKLDAGITKQMPKRQTAETNASNNSAADAVTTSGNSVNVGTTNKRIWSSEEVDRMSLEEFRLHEEEITNAMREGRVSH